MRTIGVVTTSRADFGIYRAVLRRVVAHPDLELYLIVGGSHLVRNAGLTVEEIESEGFEIGDRVETHMASDSPGGVSVSMGAATIGFAHSFERSRPDILVVLGDRFEMHAAAVAALPFVIPMAHIHGGEATEGLIDEAIRHSITKMSHLHFVSNVEARRRVIQLGEEPWRVHVSGAPGLDRFVSFKQLTSRELESVLGIELNQPPVLVTMHPETLDYSRTANQAEELLAALSVVDGPIVFSSPNADTSGGVIANSIRNYVNGKPGAVVITSLGDDVYVSLLQQARAMVGNSSSGIIEAASFQLPVVDIGERQSGRLRGQNVLHAAFDRNSIREALRRALDPAFRKSLRGVTNPYGDGKASDRIVTILADVHLDQDLVIKRFFDLNLDGSSQ